MISVITPVAVTAESTAVIKSGCMAISRMLRCAVSTRAASPASVGFNALTTAAPIQYSTARLRNEPTYTLSGISRLLRRATSGPK